MSANPEDYKTWKAIISGNRPETVRLDDPLCGYWRIQAQKDGPFYPVAIFRKDGELIVLVKGQPPKSAERVRMFCWKNPISYETYTEFMKTGTWPDDPPPVASQEIGANNPPDEFQMLASEIESHVEKGKSIEVPVNKAGADKIADWAKDLRGLYKKTDELRKKEKAPWQTKADEVDDKFRPLLDGLKTLGTKLGDMINKFDAAEKKRQQDEVTQRAMKIAQDAVKAKQDGAPPPPPPEPPKNEPVRYGSAPGRKAKVVENKTAEIRNYDECLAYFAGHVEVKMLVQKLADLAIQNDVEVPGCVTVVSGFKTKV